ncbi:MAG: acrylyl-CoA reductase family protein [Vagococcus sp.]
MTSSTFEAITVEKKENEIVTSLKTCQLTDLSEGNTLIKVHYSAVNFKDVLSTVANGGVIRSYPMIPGIDLTGEIVETTDQRFRLGDLVVVTGHGTGVSHTGGFSEFARVPNDWVLPLPNRMTTKKAAIIGTAGITAAEAVKKLEKAGLEDNKEAHILVTGATGGVGSFSIALLHALGYNNITALSRKNELTYLSSLGAKEIVTRDTIRPETIRPLQKQIFDFVLDTIGGDILEIILPQVTYGGAVVLCGNASGNTFTTTVLPFILRGISLLGVDSVNLSNEEKETLWQRLSAVLQDDVYPIICFGEARLDTVLDVIETIKKGQHVGRTILAL